MRFRPVLVVALLVLVVPGAMVAGSPSASGGAGLAASETRVDGISAGTGGAVGVAPNETTDASGAGFQRADPGLVVTIQLRGNGNARWHVTHRYAVNGSNETAAFEEFASAVQAGERDVGVGRETYVQFASAASEATEREMQVRNAGWTSSNLENGTGELTYSFTWTNFSQVSGDQLVVGDAFRSPNGTWFPRLYDGQRLVVRPPPGLNIVQTPPDKGLNQRALVWNGYREFEPGYLSVVLERPTDPVTTTTPATPPTTTNASGPPGGDGPDEEGLSPFLLGVGFALLLMFVGAGSYFFARRQTLQENGSDAGAGAEASDGGSPPSAGASTDADATANSDGVSSTGGEEPSDSSASAAGADAAAAATAGGATADAAMGDENDADDADDFDEALLSDEERVLRLLDENGGRMKQANIVTETGWSNAKVSQLLSGMDDDDDIQKLRIGRENLITLPDENVADFGDDE